MAVKKRSDVVQSGNVEIPYDRYQARVKKCTAGESKNSGNPMLTFEMEIVAKEPLKLGDARFDINGIGFSMYGPYHDDKAITNILDLNKKLGLPEEINTEAPNTAQYEGQVWDLLLKSEKQIKRKQATPEQAKQRIPGDPILDASGKEVALGYNVKANLWDVLGLAQEQSDGTSRPAGM